MSKHPRVLLILLQIFYIFLRNQFIKRWRSSGGERTAAATCWGAEQSGGGTGLSGADCLPAKFLFCFLSDHKTQGRSSPLCVETIRRPKSNQKPLLSAQGYCRKTRSGSSAFPQLIQVGGRFPFLSACVESDTSKSDRTIQPKGQRTEQKGSLSNRSNGLSLGKKHALGT